LGGENFGNIFHKRKKEKIILKKEKIEAIPIILETASNYLF